MNKPLTSEQVQTLHDALRGHHLETFITLALITGMRRDELLRLKWKDVSLAKRELTVRHAKNKSRTIPITDDLASLLTQHGLRQIEARVRSDLTLPNFDLVFSDAMGEAKKPDQLVSEWDSFLEQAELPRIGFHDLRQTIGHVLYEQYKAERQAH